MTIVTDDKLINSMAMTAMIMAAGVYLIQTVQQILVPVEEAEEEEEMPFGSPWLLAVGLIMNVDYSDEEPLYIGEARPGTANDDAAWRIYRYEYVIIDGDREMAGLRFAEGSTKFDKVWDDRTEYEYS